MPFGWFLCSWRWRPLAAATFARIYSSTNINFHHQTFFHRKVVINSNGLKYVWAKIIYWNCFFLITLSSEVGIPTDSDGFRRIPMNSDGFSDRFSTTRHDTEPKNTTSVPRMYFKPLDFILTFFWKKSLVVKVDISGWINSRKIPRGDRKMIGIRSEFRGFSLIFL